MVTSKLKYVFYFIQYSHIILKTLITVKNYHEMSKKKNKMLLIEMLNKNDFNILYLNIQISWCICTSDFLISVADIRNLEMFELKFMLIFNHAYNTISAKSINPAYDLSQLQVLSGAIN